MVYIHGIGHFHPENIIDNSFLENLDIGTNNQWILERVGILSRRTVLPLDYIKQTKNKDIRQAREASLYTNCQTACLASQRALEDAQITSDQVGMIISGSCTPDSICPAEACTIANSLEVECPSFDLNSACSTVAAQIHFLSQMNQARLPDFILLVIPENNTRNIDYSDRSSAVLWGDCTTALIVSTKIKSSYLIKNTIFESSPKSFNKVSFPVGGHFYQEGRTVQTFAIKKSISLINQLSSSFKEDFYFIGHQANKMMLDSICNLASIKNEKHLYNVDQYGNCGASGAISVLSMNKKHFCINDNIIVSIVGAGLSWGGFHIEVI